MPRLPPHLRRFVAHGLINRLHNTALACIAHRDALCESLVRGDDVPEDEELEALHRATVELEKAAEILAAHRALLEESDRSLS